jgi:branched-chain amino acid transport system ATP-binding protein
MTVLLRAQGLRKAYGDAEILRGIDIEVEAGEAHVVIGPNGAGKTTLFRVLSGEVRANAGTIAFQGRDVSGLPDWRRARLGMGRTFQTSRVFSEMSVLENLVVAAEARLRNARQRIGPRFGVRPGPAARADAAAVMEETGLANLAGQMADALAHGDRKRLELAMAITLRPRLLLLDEPTAGMAPGDRMATVTLIDRLMREHGLSLLLTEHDMGVVFGLAQRLTVLNYGAVIASGTVAAVQADPRVQEVYLGHADAA